MLIDFFYSLRAAKLPVSVKELLTLLECLQADVVGPRAEACSLDDFYFLARTVLVKDEKHFDRFDRAFGAYFHGTCLPGHQHRIVYALACKGRGEQHGIRVVLRRLAAPGFHFQKAQNAFHIGLRYAAPAGAAKSFMGVCCGGLSQGSSRGSWPWRALLQG